MIVELGHQLLPNWQDSKAEALGTLQILDSGSSWFLSDTSVYVEPFGRKYSPRQRDLGPSNRNRRYV